MARPALTAAARKDTGKGVARRLRAAGKLPAVVYGKGTEPVAVAVDPIAVAGILNSKTGANTAIDLQIEGEKAPRLTLIKDFQVHPFKRTLKHVDFWQVQPDTEVVVETPLRRVGRAAIEGIGAKLYFTHKTVKVRSKAIDIRPAIEFDASTITEGRWVVTVSELPMPEGCEAVYKTDYAVLQVKMPKVQAGDAASGEEEAETDEG